MSVEETPSYEATFAAEIERAIQAYISDPDRNTTRFKSKWLDVGYNSVKIGGAIKSLHEIGRIEKLGKSKGCHAWRYCRDPTVSVDAHEIQQQLDAGATDVE